MAVNQGKDEKDQKDRRDRKDERSLREKGGQQAQTAAFSMRCGADGLAISGAIDEAGDAFLFGTVFTAEEDAVVFEAVSEDAGAAVGAGRGEGLDGAFEAVEGVGFAIHGDVEGFVVFVSAGVATCHGSILLVD